MRKFFVNNSVFMSIKDVHTNRILQRIKNHEFRTKKPINKIEYIIVYVPTPIKELKYILKVSEPIISPNKILVEGYGNEKFNEENKLKYAYPIKNVFEINKPLKLSELRENFGFVAPQSFAYGERYNELLKYIEEVGVRRIY